MTGMFTGAILGCPGGRADGAGHVHQRRPRGREGLNLPVLGTPRQQLVPQFSEPARADGLPNLLQQTCAEAEIVLGSERDPEQLVGVEEVPEIGAAVAGAGVAVTALLQGPV